MKKRLILGCIAVMMCAVFIVSVSAQTFWNFTEAADIIHAYVNGGAECSVAIYAQDGSIITNVNIRLDRVASGMLFNIASWNNLSAGSILDFSDFVPNVEPYYSYRLSFTAEVWYNGNVEYLNLHSDVYYTEDTLRASSWITD